MATEKKLKDPTEAALSAIEQALNLDTEGDGARANGGGEAPTAPQSVDEARIAKVRASFAEDLRLPEIDENELMAMRGIGSASAQEESKASVEPPAEAAPVAFGPDKTRVANDDRANVGALMQALQARPSRKPYAYAAAGLARLARRPRDDRRRGRRRGRAARPLDGRGIRRRAGPGAGADDVPVHRRDPRRALAGDEARRPLDPRGGDAARPARDLLHRRGADRLRRFGAPRRSAADGKTGIRGCVSPAAGGSSRRSCAPRSAHGLRSEPNSRKRESASSLSLGRRARVPAPRRSSPNGRAACAGATPARPDLLQDLESAVRPHRRGDRPTGRAASSAPSKAQG